MGLHNGRRNPTPLSNKEAESWNEYLEKRHAASKKTVWHELVCRVCGRPFQSRLDTETECPSYVEAFCE